MMNITGAFSYCPSFLRYGISVPKAKQIKISSISVFLTYSLYTINISIIVIFEGWNSDEEKNYTSYRWYDLSQL